jgi:cell division septum initiation protein DivIVA
VELNRAKITGQAFPQATDGYDRDAVDRHLREIAEAVEHTSEPVGADAGEQMRSIVEGAEHSARALRETAQREADELREAARQEAEAVREKAARESSDQVAAARGAVKSLLERVEALGLGVEDSRRHVVEAAEAMAQRLGADSEPLVATLRERARALGSELDLIGSGLAGGAVAAARERDDQAEQAAGPAPVEPKQGGAGVADPREPGTGLSAGDLDDAAEALDGQAPLPEPGGEEAAVAPASGDSGTRDSSAAVPGTERARLVALNMAVSGTPRAEAERHLREELSIEDPGTILDEVYARAEREG